MTEKIRERTRVALSHREEVKAGKRSESQGLGEQQWIDRYQIKFLIISIRWNEFINGYASEDEAMIHIHRQLVSTNYHVVTRVGTS